jgi:hypothetical protein
MAAAKRGKEVKIKKWMGVKTVWIYVDGNGVKKRGG